MRNNVTFKNPKEIQIRKQLQTLFSDWKLQVSKKPPIIFKDDGKEYLTTDYGKITQQSIAFLHALACIIE